MCSNAPHIFSKGKISEHDLHIDQVLKTNIFKTSSSEPFGCENELFNLNTSKFKDTKLVFCCKDLTLPAQIPYPNETKFKFPTSWAQTTVKCPWAAGGGGRESKLLIDQHIKSFLS